MKLYIYIYIYIYICCLRYKFCCAWILDIRISTCYVWGGRGKGETVLKWFVKVFIREWYGIFKWYSYFIKCYGICYIFKCYSYVTVFLFTVPLNVYWLWPSQNYVSVMLVYRLEQVHDKCNEVHVEYCKYCTTVARLL